MKKYILKSLFVSVLCMLAASCQDTEIVETLEASQAQIVFPIALDSPSARSRSSWDGYTGLGNGNEYDSHIDFNQFIVQIEANGKTYPVTSIIQLEGGNKFVGIVDEEIKSETLQNAKLSIFANMGKESVAETFSQDAENIPMWGVKTVSKLEFAPGKREEVSDPVFMLRAMAKMEVALTPECAAEYDLKAVTLNKHNATGYCLPVGVDAATNTQNMSTAGVFNPKAQGEQTSLQFEPATETSYVVYLPEVAKGTTEEDCLKIEVQLLPKNAPEGTEPEIGTFAVMNYPQNGEPEAINIIRNHWYKYTISGFAASEIQLDYVELDWQPVNFEVGGDGFLFLNKDVIEIYNSNIDADQLTFASSSPIKSIELKDSYKHYRNGEIKETPVGETADEVYAYYMNKFGVLTQLSSEEGTDEAVVLANISATVKEENKKILNGGIVVNSPFMPENEASETALQSESHYNTIRYLEFLVTNEQNLTATFRVMQYPPVVITNVEGYYSYRDDFTIGAEDFLHHNPNAFQGEFGKIKPEKNGSIINFENPVAPFFTLAGFLPYHTHECNEDGVILSTSCPSAYEGYEELLYGFMERPYYRSFSASGPIAAVFHRDHYQDVNGNHMASQTILKPGENESNYYQALGVKYYDETTGKYYRRHYTGNFFETFWPKIARKVHTTDGTVDSWEWSYEQGLVKDEVNNTGKTSTQNVAYGNKVVVNRSKGQADIYKLGPNENYNGWKNYPYTRYLYKKWRYQSGRWKSTKTEYEDVENIAERDLFNHRMYHIKTTTVSNDYVIGYPDLVDVNGNVINSVEGYTAEGEANSRKVSPSFMVASQLGETILPKNEYHYVMPGAGGIYTYAKEQCKEYVETNYTDLNNNNQWDEGEPVTHYNDWRLPTKAEVEMIINYQENSRVMDMLMNGEYYYCASSLKGVYDENTVLSSKITNPQKTGYYMRCVRDVKPGQDDNK